jgi:hypothetical protein
MRPMTIIILGASALGAFTAGCSVREQKVVAPPPAATVVTPAPGAVVYPDAGPGSRSTVTTVR